MLQFGVFAVMLSFAMLPFWLLTRLTRSGQSGLALSIVAVIGATFAIFFYASSRPFGVDPVFAMGVAMVACVPAFLGSISGMLLGAILRKADNQKAAASDEDGAP